MSTNAILYQGRVYDRIRSGTCCLSTALTYSKLQVNSLTAVLEQNTDELLYFQQDDPITYIHGDKQVGVFYLQKVDQISRTSFKIYATSAIGFLLNRYHKGGIYSGILAKDLIDSLCGSIPHIVTQEVGAKKLYGWLPIANCRDNLNQVLMATSSTVTTDLDGKIHIEGIWDGLSTYKPASTEYSDGASVQSGSRITDVEVTEHQYSMGSKQTTLFEGTCLEDDVITFDKPMHSLHAEGFTIKEGGANYAIVSAGNGILTGKEYIHNTRIVQRKVFDSAENNTKKLSKCTLISIMNSNSVADQLLEFYKNYQYIESNFIYENEKPGDRGLFFHPYKRRDVDAVISDIDITMSSTLKSKEKALIGYIPLQAQDTEYYDRVIVLKSSGTWIPPEGVKTVTAVLIGGGQGGQAGSKGEDTPEPTLVSQGSSVTDTSTQISAVSSYKSGNGGLPGNPGEGGKILQVTLTITPGDSFSYNCGNGGQGELYGSDVGHGNYGEPTIFGTLSSDSGSSMEFGYTEPVSHEVYANKGAIGISGGFGVRYNGSLEEGWTKEVPEPITANKTQGESFTSTPGADETTTVEEHYGKYNQDNGSFSVIIPGSCGGGPAWGFTQECNGQPGMAGESSYRSFSSNKGSVKGVIATVGKPGNGGTASKPDPQSLGRGGSGGNGGGGAGAPCPLIKVSNRYSRANPTLSPGKIQIDTTNLGLGGDGSDGGDGGKGCVILYYKEPKPKTSGLLMDSNNCIIVDKYGRFLVV